MTGFVFKRPERVPRVCLVAWALTSIKLALPGIFFDLSFLGRESGEFAIFLGMQLQRRRDELGLAFTRSDKLQASELSWHLQHVEILGK